MNKSFPLYTVPSTNHQYIIRENTLWFCLTHFCTFENMKHPDAQKKDSSKFATKIKKELVRKFLLQISKNEE